MKVAIVSPYDYSKPSGVNNHVSNLSKYLTEKGVTSKIIAPASTSKDFDSNNFIPMGKPISIPSGGSVARVSLSFWLRSRVEKILEEGKFDVIHMHEPFAGAITLSALVSNVKNSPIKIATYHSYEGSNIYKFFSHKLLNKYSNFLDGRIAVSNPAKDFIHKFMPAEYTIIPNAVEVDKFRTAEPFSEYIDGKVNILFLSRLEKRKGLKYLISAYVNLKKMNSNIRLIIVGGGKVDSESLKVLSDSSVEDVILAGEVTEEDKIRYYHSADIFCAPATGQESFGIVLLESMASKVPIVATNIDGFMQVVSDRKESLLVDPKNVNDLIQALSELIYDPKLRKKIADAGYSKVERYSWDIVCGKVIDYYQHVSEIKNRISGSY
ncbi:MAG: glycosyltransferase family 4 protein [Dehalococcoidia bacterium]